jgi:hypothetical protein
MSTKKKKHILLRGEGIHQHTLYGDFTIEESTDFSKLTLSKDGVLKHEQPNGSFGEHKSLLIEKGVWVMGKQVEYNPFKGEVTRIWD